MSNNNYLYYFSKGKIFDEFFEEHLEKIGNDCYVKRGKYYRLSEDKLEECESHGEFLYYLDELRYLLRILSDDEEIESFLKDTRTVFRSGLPPNRNDFRYNVKVFKYRLKEIQKEFSKLKKFSVEEIDRLDEALTSLQNYCYFSAVLNSAVAVESRLHKITNGKYIKKRKTLGFLINLISEKNYFERYQIPNRHISLLQMLNQHRIIAVHPKKEDLHYQTALAIIALTLDFLLDTRNI